MMSAQAAMYWLSASVSSASSPPNAGHGISDLSPRFRSAAAAFFSMLLTSISHTQFAGSGPVGRTLHQNGSRSLAEGVTIAACSTAAVDVSPLMAMPGCTLSEEIENKILPRHPATLAHMIARAKAKIDKTRYPESPSGINTRGGRGAADSY